MYKLWLIWGLFSFIAILEACHPSTPSTKATHELSPKSPTVSPKTAKAKAKAAKTLAWWKKLKKIRKLKKKKEKKEKKLTTKWKPVFTTTTPKPTTPAWPCGECSTHNIISNPKGKNGYNPVVKLNKDDGCTTGILYCVAENENQDIRMDYSSSIDKRYSGFILSTGNIRLSLRCVSPGKLHPVFEKSYVSSKAITHASCVKLN